MSQKSPPFEFFDILQQNMLIKPKGSPFYIFRHYATFSERKKSNISSFFSKKVLRFLSLRYSADFRRSRLVYSQNIFWIIIFLIIPMGPRDFIDMVPHRVRADVFSGVRIPRKNGIPLGTGGQQFRRGMPTQVVTSCFSQTETDIREHICWNNLLFLNEILLA